ncbi:MULTISPECIES: ATP-binding cassette domain-containing protein [Myroides]|uniref:ATP-binding cassette domain-containing protein n=1 Tax=Myroides TaxID=76831 RepID=UPI001CE1CF8A|nr:MULTISPECIES: ATP-binding cassette domain-containing protein [Myroides]MDX4973743.1 ATP-binding cassette domain-containing protein [Myroides odoratimimus]MEC4027831.1 ATP-binding cassette domain-containing protein [Myroides odoratimimus]
MSYNHTLHIDSLNYTVENKPILRGIYFTSSTGDILNIRGRNGSGKSTLMKILFGNTKPDHIHIKVDNKVITNRHKLNQYFSYKPQFNIFPRYLTVKDVVKEDMIRNTSLHQYLDTRISDLSTGEQQLIQTLYILNLPQSICLLDEPFAGISPLLQEFIADAIKTAARHKIIILTDHNTDLVDTIATKSLLLENGVLKPMP